MMEHRADSFLRLVRKAQRGRHKIYLGYCAGVGKTYQMLLEAQRFKEDGIDLKASLRSSLRGKPQLFVKRPLKGRMRPVAGAPVPLSYTPHLELQPVVFLFSNDAPLADLSWGCLAAGTDGLYEDLSEQGKRLFRSLPTPAPHLFLESISAGEAVREPCREILPDPVQVAAARRMRVAILRGQPVEVTVTDAPQHDGKAALQRAHEHRARVVPIQAQSRGGVEPVGDDSSDQ